MSRDWATAEERRGYRDWQLRRTVIEECALALEQEAGDQELIHLQFALQTIRALKEKP